jgi:hypothetical protein
MASSLAEIAAVAAVLVLIGRLEAAYRAARTFRGARALACPVDGAPVAVELGTVRAALFAFFGRARLRPSRCSRWAPGERCPGTCVSGIEAAPEEGLARMLVERWIRGRACALCGYELQAAGAAFPAALLSADGSSIEWGSVALERLAEALRTHRPICWNCHVVGTLHRERPDLFVSRRDESTGSRS